MHDTAPPAVPTTIDGPLLLAIAAKLAESARLAEGAAIAAGAAKDPQALQESTRGDLMRKAERLNRQLVTLLHTTRKALETAVHQANRARSLAAEAPRLPQVTPIALEGPGADPT